jgi:hypothetical protein
VPTPQSIPVLRCSSLEFFPVLIHQLLGNFLSGPQCHLPHSVFFLQEEKGSPCFVSVTIPKISQPQYLYHVHNHPCLCVCLPCYAVNFLSEILSLYYFKTVCGEHSSNFKGPTSNLTVKSFGEGRKPSQVSQVA